MKVLNVTLNSLVLFSLIIVGCAKNNSGNPAVPTSAQASQPSGPQSETKKDSATQTSGLSDSASVDGMTIKRLDVGGYTMDVFDPNPKGAGGTQPGALVLSLCSPRITDDNLSALSEAAYPIILSESSQVILHRDTSYRFGDGTSASSAPPYVLMTCGKSTSANMNVLSSKSKSTKVQVKHLRAGDTTIEVLNPNPKGVSSSQSSELILVVCAPRITDTNLSQNKQNAYPILLTEGSQLALKRDTSYRFADGTSASSVAPEVVVSCDTP